MKSINLTIIPQKPGVYLFRNKQGAILYIGKASRLKSRVNSYFRKSSQLAPHKLLMLEKIKKVEFIVTSSETEALLLESNLIKLHQPPFNIDLKDDKNFLYIKITTAEDFPRVFTVRKINRDKAKYFGPYVSAISVRQTLHLLRKLFPHRNFTKEVSPRQVQYYADRYPELLGPQNKNEYQKTIQRIIQFLNGHYQDIVADLKQSMAAAAKEKQFEKAALCRDKITAIARVMEKQKVVSTKGENQDIISLTKEETTAAINLFSVRHGILLNKQSFILRHLADQTDAEIIQAFIEQYYPQATNKPKEIIVPLPLSAKKLLENAFNFKIIVPQKGVKRQYLKLGEENAANYLAQQKASWQKASTAATQALRQLQKFLALKKIPQRIEIFDISNVQGQNAVGSMVVFTAGQPDKKWYRKFKIKTVQGANDPAMLAEVVGRRFAHLKVSAKTNASAWPQPDLVILDGGPGQLSVVKPHIPKNIAVLALAKKQEDIYLPNKKGPLNLKANTPAYFLIQRMRDEAHRFAITFYRKKHGEALTESPWNNIPGLGPKKRKLLIKTFGTLEKAQRTTAQELSAVIGEKLAKKLKQSYD